MNLYLDSNAHLPLHSKALEALIKFNQSPASHGHPSALNTPGRESSNALERARSKIAELIGAKNENQIIFTSGCTSAVDWGLKILFNLEGYKKEEIAVSPMEHPAVGKICEAKEIQQLQCTPYGIVISPSLNIKKIICLSTQNEIGTIQPLKDLKCQYLFSDISQSIGKIPFNIGESNIDIAAAGAHKWGGNPGFGFMYLKNIDHWEPYGDQLSRYMDFPGTPNVAGAVVSAVALEEAILSLSVRMEKMAEFQKILEDELLNIGFEILGYNAPRSKGTTYFAGLNGVRKLF